MYDERLSAPLSLWLLPVAAGLTSALILLPYGLTASLVAMVLASALSSVALGSYGSPRIRVVQGVLLAGEARLPLEVLGQALPLDRKEALAWRTWKSDPRAFMLLRSYIHTALRVEVTDPADPTPYLYLSTRHPQRLAEVIEAGRASQREGQGQGAQGASARDGEQPEPRSDRPVG
ncbi:DUF3093 domain-containing protein [Kitasatospora cineracea]|uniref:DUF3093 family protein n=1 Tax=Kitasatospora cineracea TaxID=88074 RepID=A0A8G1XAW0_9ACTN|nr:DUF3093 domain-containing protein [Kitasatospora cineracea]ROR43024.1 hypothetical protein EDD39_1159 [Kitasatospora cineracea]